MQSHFDHKTNLWTWNCLNLVTGFLIIQLLLSLIKGLPFAHDWRVDLLLNILQVESSAMMKNVFSIVISNENHNENFPVKRKIHPLNRAISKKVMFSVWSDMKCCVTWLLNQKIVNNGEVLLSTGRIVQKFGRWTVHHWFMSLHNNVLGRQIIHHKHVVFTQ